MTHKIDIDRVRSILVAAVCNELRLRTEDLRTDLPLTEYGVESLTALAIAVELEDELGLRNIDPTLMWDFPTVDALAGKMVELLAAAAPAASAEQVGAAAEGATP